MLQDLCLHFHGYQLPTINSSKAWQDLQEYPTCDTHTPSPVHEGLDCLNVARAGAKILQKTRGVTESTNKRLLLFVNYPNLRQYGDISNVWSRK